MPGAVIFARPRPVSPDVYDFDHSAFAGSGATPPKCAEDVALFTGQDLETLPFRAGNMRSAFDMSFHDDG